MLQKNAPKLEVMLKKCMTQTELFIARKTIKKIFTLYLCNLPLATSFNDLIFPC